ncbi:ankyrin repeat-containing domain protein, partial [Globomyces pollinis-pini]
MNESYLDLLPTELLYLIINFIKQTNPQTLLTLKDTNRRLRSILNDIPHLWLQLSRQILLTDPHFDKSLQSVPDEYLIFTAINLNNINVMQSLIQTKCDLNYQADYYKYTPLMSSITAGSIPITKLLLSTNVDVTLRDIKGKTALFKACSEGNLSIVKWLIQIGSNVNSKSYQNTTPLHTAAKHGYLDICSILLEHGAHVNVQNVIGRTPYHYAAQSPNASVMELLYQHDQK